jgi:hypothetical protein
MLTQKKLRIARPSNDLAAIEKFYCDGLGLERLGGFEDHQGIDGLMLGQAGCLYHFEFTRHRDGSIQPSPTKEDLVIFYIPEMSEWQNITTKIESNGFKPITSHNPYWDQKGKTYQDPDGYRIVIQNANWD